VQTHDVYSTVTHPLTTIWIGFFHKLTWNIKFNHDTNATLTCVFNNARDVILRVFFYLAVGTSPQLGICLGLEWKTLCIDHMLMKNLKSTVEFMHQSEPRAPMYQKLAAVRKTKTKTKNKKNGTKPTTKNYISTHIYKHMPASCPVSSVQCPASSV